MRRNSKVAYFLYTKHRKVTQTRWLQMTIYVYRHTTFTRTRIPQNHLPEFFPNKTKKEKVRSQMRKKNRTKEAGQNSKDIKIITDTR